MTPDFWAGYISGAVGIIVGNPLDVKKVQLQAAQYPSSQKYFPLKSSLLAGAAAPILAYGPLNGILFEARDKTEEALNYVLQPSAFPKHNNISSPNAGSSNTIGSNLWTTWLAGAVGGLAIWIVSTPAELIKTKTQLVTSPTGGIAYMTSNQTPLSSWEITRAIFRKEGTRGLYCGGTVTALRDTIGYGFYFWAYELCDRIMTAQLTSWSAVTGDGNNNRNHAELMRETAKVLLCGGIAGVVSWGSIYPLDVVKTRIQGQISLDQTTTPLLGSEKRKGPIRIFKDIYREKGMRVFFQGLGWCSVRAFLVNAVQWGVYELVMSQISQSKHDRGK